jgi:hypothetical protein
MYLLYLLGDVRKMSWRCFITGVDEHEQYIKILAQYFSLVKHFNTMKIINLRWDVKLSISGPLKYVCKLYWMWTVSENTLIVSDLENDKK